MPKKTAIRSSLEHIFRGIAELRAAFDDRRKFTIDGRLVGDIGEVIAELEYDLMLDDTSRANHDATTPSGRRVQIKATFQNSLTYSCSVDLYLGLKLNMDGTYEEIYNGPGYLIANEFKDRKGIGEKLLSFPISKLRELQKNVPEGHSVARHPSVINLETVDRKANLPRALVE